MLFNVAIVLAFIGAGMFIAWETGWRAWRKRNPISRKAIAGFVGLVVSFGLIVSALSAGIVLAVKKDEALRRPAPQAESAAAPVAESVKPGDEMTVPERHSASVDALEPVSREFGRHCFISGGSKAVVLATHGDHLLVRFHHSAKEGVPECPDGSLLVLSKETFLEYRSIQDELGRDLREYETTMEYFRTLAAGRQLAASDNPKIGFGAVTRLEIPLWVERLDDGERCEADLKAWLTALAVKGPRVLAKYEYMVTGNKDDRLQVRDCLNGQLVVVKTEDFLANERIRREEASRIEATEAFRRWLGDHPGAGR